MSESARQSFTDKAEATLKPDSQKSGTERFSDKIKGNTDSAASSLEPESHKSTTQKIGDTFSGNSNQNDKSFTEKAKETFGFGNQERR